MNKYVKLATVATTAAVMGMSTMALAEQPAPPTPEMDRILINMGGEITLDQDGTVEGEVLAQLVFNLSESVKAEITADLKEVYEGIVDDDFDINDAIEEGKLTFDTVNIGPVQRIVVAIKMDIDRINMSALDPDSSLAGSGAEGVAALRLHMKSSYLEGLVVTVAENNTDGQLAVDRSSVRVSARAAESMGMVIVEGELGYTFNDVGDDVYDATAGISLDLSNQVSGLEVFAQGTADSVNGLSNSAVGLNMDFNQNWSATGVYESDYVTDESRVVVGLNRTNQRGHIATGYLAMDTDTKKTKWGFKYEIPMTNLWRR